MQEYTCDAVGIKLSSIFHQKSLAGYARVVIDESDDLHPRAPSESRCLRVRRFITELPHASCNKTYATLSRCSRRMHYRHLSTQIVV